MPCMTLSGTRIHKYLGTIKTQLQNLALPAARAAQSLWVLYETWQVSRKNKGLERAPNPYSCLVNLRTLPSRVLYLVVITYLI